MKAKIKAKIKGITIGDYHYDAKGGLVIVPRTTIIQIDRRGAK